MDVHYPDVVPSNKIGAVAITGRLLSNIRPDLGAFILYCGTLVLSYGQLNNRHGVVVLSLA